MQTLGDKLLVMQARIQWLHKQTADIATATVNVTTVDGNLVGSALTTADTITVVDAASVSAADADTFGAFLGDAGTLRPWLHKPNPQTSPLPPSMSPLWMATLLVLLTTADTITVVDAASVMQPMQTPWATSSPVMQARSRSVVTQTKTSQTSPLPPSMSPLWMVQPLLVLLSPLPTPSPLSMQPV